MWLGVIVLLLCGPATKAEPSPQLVLEKLIAAKGGAKLSAVSRIKMIYGKSSKTYDLPGRFYVYEDNTPGPLGRYEASYDRSTGKHEETFGMPPSTKSSPVREAEIALQTDTLWLLVGGKEGYPKPIKTESLTIRNKRLIGLWVAAGDKEYIYMLDPKTYLPRWFREASRLCEPADVDCGYTIAFENYKSYDGVMLPTKVSYTGGEAFGTFDYEVRF